MDSSEAFLLTDGPKKKESQTSNRPRKALAKEEIAGKRARAKAQALRLGRYAKDDDGEKQTFYHDGQFIQLHCAIKSVTVSELYKSYAGHTASHRISAQRRK